MQQRALGRSGITVSEIGLGTMTFGSMADARTSLAILDKAFDAGVDFIDVAEIYPVPPDARYVGRSEEICGKWLADRSRDSVIVATKVAGPLGGWFQAPLRSGKTALDRHHIERACEESLRRLGTDYVDLYQTHWPDPNLPVDETLEALDRLVEAGKVRAVGCSNESCYSLTRSLWRADRAGVRRFETIQNPFSLLNRRFEDELAHCCRKEGLRLLAYSPIAGGVLSGKYLPSQAEPEGRWPEGARFSLYRDHSPRTKSMTRRFLGERSRQSTARFQALAQEHGIPLPTLAVAWTLSHDFVGSSLVGATTPEQLDESLAAAELRLDAELLSACDEVSREIPYPMG